MTDDIVRKPGYRPYKYRRDSCPKHNHSGLEPTHPNCPGCIWEQAWVDSLGPPPPPTDSGRPRGRSRILEP